MERHDARKMERPYVGPYKITNIYTNGTVTIKKGSVYQREYSPTVIPRDYVTAAPSPKD